MRGPGVLRRPRRCGGNKVEDSENWEVKQDAWDGFTAASVRSSSWWREASDSLVVVSCMLRNSKSHHFSQSRTAALMDVELSLPVFAVN